MEEKKIRKIARELKQDLDSCAIYTDEYLANKLKEIIGKLVVENIDLKNYLIDTDVYGIDRDTLSARVERYEIEMQDIKRVQL
jgi:hypothetical protein